MGFFYGLNCIHIIKHLTDQTWLYKTVVFFINNLSDKNVYYIIYQVLQGLVNGVNKPRQLLKKLGINCARIGLLKQLCNKST
jgi:hypothetical protein